MYTYFAGNGDLLEKIERNGVLFREYDYDLVGRTTAVWKSGVGTTTYSYNDDSRLVGITYPGPSSDSMTYNGMGTRVSRTEAGVTNDYIRNGVDVTDPVLADSGAQLRSEPRTGRDKHPFPAVAGRGQSATNRSARPRARHWARRRGKNPTRLQNGVKNTAAQSGCSQTISASRKYDAWGNVRSSTGTWQGPFGHASGFGYQSSDRSGLQLLGHRYYDPETGRFLTRDPIKDGNNWHAYGGGINNPITGVDADGLKTLTVFGLEFSWDVIKEGITTGLHGLGSGLSFGAYDGGEHKHDPGFGFSRKAGTVAAVCLLAACGLKAASANGYVYGVKNGLGGINMTHKGKAFIRLEIQQWKKDGKPVPWWQRPHYHNPADEVPHHPWQGGWW